MGNKLCCNEDRNSELPSKEELNNNNENNNEYNINENNRNDENNFNNSHSLHENNTIDSEKENINKQQNKKKSNKYDINNVEDINNMKSSIFDNDNENQNSEEEEKNKNDEDNTANIPVIVMGETGWGKTLLIKKLNQILNNGKMSIKTINIHPEKSEKDIYKEMIMRKWSKMKKKRKSMIIITIKII